MSTPGLDTILNALAGSGRLGHLTLSVRPSGGYQGSHKPPMSPGYRCASEDSPVAALVAALAPPHGMSWEDHLGERGAAMERTQAAVIEEEPVRPLTEIGRRIRGEIPAPVSTPLQDDFSDLI